MQRGLQSHLPPPQTSDRARSLTPEVEIVLKIPYSDRSSQSYVTENIVKVELCERARNNDLLFAASVSAK